MISSEKAILQLKKGEVVAIPTETVYGLAGNILMDAAVQKIFTLKSRPTNHPLIIHISNSEQLKLYAQDIPAYVELLTKAFWPGPMTLILKKTDRVSDLVTGGQDSVGIRMPAHPIALEIIEGVGAPLAAPSANLFGHVSPTTAQHVIDEFGNQVPVVDGGACHVGIESTIIDATDPKVCCILREGDINAAAIKKALGSSAQLIEKPIDDKRVSGNLKKHYAPRKKIFLFSTLNDLKKIQAEQGSIFVLHYADDFKTELGFQCAKNPRDYARQFYHQLRLADASACTAIAVQSLPDGLGWVALRDRLAKAST